MNYPVIGIVCGTSPDWRIDGNSYRSYAGAVKRFGAQCVPLDIKRDYTLEDCDGLMIPGGPDVHPDLYDRMPGDECLSISELESKYHMSFDIGRDPLDLDNIRDAIYTEKPFLGICRGFQSVNIALARKLIPDLPSCVPNVLPHAAKNGVSERHTVTIEAGSWMEKIYCAREIEVNSRHHQGLIIDMVPECMRATAIAPDGVVEAMEMLNYSFGVAVQWHPERTADPYIYEPSGALFRAFVEACKSR